MEHSFGLDIPISLEEVCSPKRTALIVYDMQIGVIRQIPDGPKIIAQVLRVVQAARAAGIRIFYMRHMSLPNELAGITQLRTAMAWQRVAKVTDVKPWFPRDSPGFQITPELSPLPSEAIFDKISMSAFVGTPLDMALRDCGMNSFVIVGIALEIGIEPTVRHALDLGYIPVVITDACGGRDKEAQQRALEGFSFTGGSFQTDTATICRLFAQNAVS